MKRILLALAALAGSIVGLVSCGQQAWESKQYDTLNRSKWTTATIEVHWISADRISDVCKSLGTKDGGGNPATNVYGGCARSKPGNIKICEVYAVEPRDFDDLEHIKHFGHEAWHCFGARHT